MNYSVQGIKTSPTRKPQSSARTASPECTKIVATRACPSPCDKLARRAKFRFAKTPNQWPISGHPVPARGAVARRHERGMGCGGRESVGAQMRSQGGLNPVSDWQARRTNDVFCVRQNRVVLTPVAGAKSAEANSDPTGFEQSQNPPTTVTRRIRRRGEHGISRKAITQGMPDASAEPVCSCAHSTLHCARDRGCSVHPAFPAPSLFEGDPCQSSGASRCESAKACPL
jgi:hypothetical protein